jgi:hypothetical protein
VISSHDDIENSGLTTLHTTNIVLVSNSLARLLKVVVVIIENTLTQDQWLSGKFCELHITIFICHSHGYACLAPNKTCLLRVCQLEAPSSVGGSVALLFLLSK